MKPAVAIILTLIPFAASAQSDTELLRSDLRNAKVAVLTEAMALPDDQANVFWPLQREYELERAKIQDARLELIKTYATQYKAMTPETAKSLGGKFFDIEQKRLDLKKEYFGKISKALSPIVAGRFIQVENQIENIIDAQIASEIPLFKAPLTTKAE